MSCWEGVVQVGSEPVDYFSAPAVFLLPGKDVAADLPVKQHQLAVDRQGSFKLGGADAFFEIAEKRVVICGQRK